MKLKFISYNVHGLNDQPKTLKLYSKYFSKCNILIIQEHKLYCISTQELGKNLCPNIRFFIPKAILRYINNLKGIKASEVCILIFLALKKLIKKNVEILVNNKIFLKYSK